MCDDSTLTRELVLGKLFDSFNFGNLGLFIGAGFSKAVVNDDFKEALSWGQLIEKACAELNVEMPDGSSMQGMAYPEVASTICDSISKNEGIGYIEAKEKLKRTLADLTNWLPDEEKTDIFSPLIEKVNPNWVITTNYDLVIERLLTGKSVSISPNNYLAHPKGVIPIYHLHGLRTDPDSIIITQEDYVQLFRPNEYRQIKLALTIKESTTLILGYGLGDVNVLSAVDWSKNLYDKATKEYPHEIIQAIRVENPSATPYRDKNGNIIIEVSELEDFFSELVEYLEIQDEEYKKRLAEIRSIIGELEENKDEKVESFINNRDRRLELLQLLSEFELHMVSPFINFISVCIGKTWEESSKYGAFNAYKKNLNILLDIIINYPYERMPPALFDFVAYSLNRVLNYVGVDNSKRIVGNSFDAQERWHNAKNDIPHKMVQELYNYSRQSYLGTLARHLKTMV
ncbi:SIR2 family protein [Sediminibacillus dalangtanensis]|uniref:SIR2 family protein n=1 Tax=Sediminibacillus dalangtanensis TaxID=2729421 RepID=A0ABX7VMX0_9BACI|nr:SIR2 family protein [Sediminibacillus dalangtanensis]QTM98151.1 SIR2 family protein [Sediminibacillus dalangtanensis]